MGEKDKEGKVHEFKEKTGWWKERYFKDKEGVMAEKEAYEKEIAEKVSKFAEKQKELVK